MNETIEQTFTLSRTFDAPRDLVFEAFANCEHLRHWWGPKGFETTHCKMDFRPGGSCHYDMRSAGGQVMWGRFDYLEITRPERLVFLNAFSNEAGELARSPFSPNWPLQVELTYTFTEAGGKTTVDVVGVPRAANEVERQEFVSMIPGMKGGFGNSFNQLAEHLQRMWERFSGNP